MTELVSPSSFFGEPGPHTEFCVLAQGAVAYRTQPNCPRITVSRVRPLDIGRLRFRESGSVEGDNFDVAGSPQDFDRYSVFLATKSQVNACFSDFQIADADMG